LHYTATPDLSLASYYYSRPVACIILLLQTCRLHYTATPDLSLASYCYSRPVAYIILLLQTCRLHRTTTPDLSLASYCYSRPVACIVLLLQTRRLHRTATQTRRLHRTATQTRRLHRTTTSRPVASNVLLPPNLLLASYCHPNDLIAGTVLPPTRFSSFSSSSSSFSFSFSSSSFSFSSSSFSFSSSSFSFSFFVPALPYQICDPLEGGYYHGTTRDTRYARRVAFLSLFDIAWQIVYPP